MLLYASTTSPYVRKVLVVIREKGLDDRVRVEWVKTTPIATDETLAKANPIGKIPALVQADGTLLVDSQVICEYLDALDGKPTLIPVTGTARWKTLRLQALANGVLEAGVVVRYEVAVRPEPLRYKEWIDAHLTKMRRTLAYLEVEAPTIAKDTNIGEIALACAIGWVEFRSMLPEARATYPKLYAFYDAFCERPSMRATAPHD